MAARTPRFIARGMAVASLVAVVTVGSVTVPAGAAGGNPNAHVGIATHPFGNSNWNLQMVFDTGTFTYMLSPLTITKGKVSGKVLPPNTTCPGVINGAYKMGKIKMTFTFPGTPCSVNSAMLTGHLSVKTGVAKGTFTATFDCAATCTWTGTKTS